MTQNNIKIAITGGIGSGKTTVSKIIEGQGFSIISCDEIYKQLLRDNKFLSRLTDEFGDILTEDGCLDRKKLSSIVFTDEKQLKKLNDLTHPAIINETIRQMADKDICFCEVPLLFEGGYEKFFDKVIVVLRDKDSRLSAVKKRDSLNENEVNLRIKTQFDYNILKFEKYYVIHNDTNLENLRVQTLGILQEIIKK